MADPYEDDDEVDTEFFGAQEKKPFLKAFQQVGQSIREGGFCSPTNGKSPKTKTREMSFDTETTSAADNVSDSDDYAHKVKTVTFSEKIEVEPLIINDDLVIDEDQDEDNYEHESVAKVEKEEKFSPKSMPLTMFILTTFVVAVLVSSFCPERFARVADFLDGIKQSPFAKFAILILALFSASEMFLCSTDGQLGGLVEFCWSLLVLFLICTGMYYTYDLEWAKSAEDN
mmetsp:Transcript_8291/g.12567  ORF Transcript_8291/g.12567 Transcript_8291/m.12567 type:complete len:229 (+) Transcript_8291:72-758(+)